MTSSFENELQTALTAAKKAGAAIDKYYNSTFTVEHKSAEQPVTEADREANEIIRTTLMGAFPEDGWLSEESVDDARRAAKKRVWIVDPLDGTKEFISHTPEFAVSIGLVVDGKPVVGVIYNPATKELAWAAKGGGAYQNGNKITVSQQADLKSATLLASRSELKRKEWEPYQGLFTIKASGGMAYKILVVARGEADGSFSLQPKSEWDYCAGVVILEEAGGMVRDVDGREFVFNQEKPLTKGIIYANARLYNQIEAIAKNGKTI